MYTWYDLSFDRCVTRDRSLKVSRLELIYFRYETFSRRKQQENFRRFFAREESKEVEFHELFS